MSTEKFLKHCPFTKNYFLVTDKEIFKEDETEVLVLVIQQDPKRKKFPFIL